VGGKRGAAVGLVHYTFQTSVSFPNCLKKKLFSNVRFHVERKTRYADERESGKKSECLEKTSTSQGDVPLNRGIRGKKKKKQGFAR